MENTCYDDTTTRPYDTKGCIGDRVNCTAVYSDERSGHHRPSGPFTSLGEAHRNVLVEQGVRCSSARQAPVASKVRPVVDRAERSSTNVIQYQKIFNTMSSKNQSDYFTHHHPPAFSRKPESLLIKPSNKPKYLLTSFFIDRWTAGIHSKYVSNNPLHYKS